MADSSPWKSGTSTSMEHSGSRWRICRMVSAKMYEPKSGRSSRSTEVMTACRRFISAMACATRAGSSMSYDGGRPWETAQ